MAITNHSGYSQTGAIQSITNTSGVWEDAEVAQAKRAHAEHSFVSNEPWSKGYRPSLEALQEQLQPEPIQVDPKLIEANRVDLRIRNIK